MAIAKLSASQQDKNEQIHMLEKDLEGRGRSKKGQEEIREHEGYSI